MHPIFLSIVIPTYNEELIISSTLGQVVEFLASRDHFRGAVRQVEGILATIGASEVISDATLASVSIVGSGMQNTPGYASRMFRILADGNINIDMITTSEIRISCIVNEDQVEQAVRLLHRGFNLDEGSR